MILCIGTTPTVQRTLVFDRLTLDDVNRAVVVDEYASGKSVNVARVAALVGADVVAAGFAGGDRGRFLLDQLLAEGVQHEFQPIAAQTRLCTTVIDRSSGTVTELVEEHAAVESLDWEALHVRCAELARARKPAVWVLSGSLPPGADQAFYATLLDRASDTAKDATIIIDTRGSPLLEVLRQPAIDARVIVKLNRSELAATVRHPLETDEALKLAMREVAPQKGGSVIVTMGKDGAVAWDGQRYWRIPTPRIEAVNPIGSGDAFAAGLAVAAEQKVDSVEAYALASACGAANALTSRAGVVAPREVERLRGMVEVTSW
jgi:tagatose 6-phosphate kinase